MDGLDLQSPKLVAKPGSMIDCLNYEIIDRQGYSRIDGYMRYDGNVSYKDVPDLSVIADRVITSVIAHPSSKTNKPILDADNNIIGYLFSFTSVSTSAADITYISFTGTKMLEGAICDGVTMDSTDSTFSESTQTQTQMNALAAYLYGLVEPLREMAVGLHWFRNSLYAVAPWQLVHYKADTDNQVVSFTAYGGLTTTYNAATATVIDKIVITEAGASDAEEGFLVVIDLGTGVWGNSTDDTYTLGGAVSVGVGTIYHQTDSDDHAIQPCCFWKAQRPSTYSVNKAFIQTGWVQQLETFTVTVTLSGVCDPFNTIVNQNTVAESTYYFESSAGNSIQAVLQDYYIVSGSFAGGNAVVRLQVRKPTANAGTHDLRITTSDDMYLEAATTTKLGDITVSSVLNYLPGVPELTTSSSRYLFRTSNFYAADAMDAFYGVTGASRALVFLDGYFTFIYTQADDDLDQPRHVEAHHLHLCLGYQSGSVLISVVGEPTNFDGLLGASEVACGDRITGLLELSGTTLGVFCEESIWGITGNTVDNFQLQVIAPNTGCIEYTLVDCGMPVYMDNRGVSMLETSANYGDFLGQRLSSPVSPWLLPRCRRGTIGIHNTSGVSFAIPVRAKNQYRIFFNDGEILTMTFVVGMENPVAFTYQRYYHQQASITDTDSRLIPFAWTSEVDLGGVERIYVSHRDPTLLTVSNYVYGLEQGNSFDTWYISHSFDTNWYFGEAPVIYTGIQKVRLHGLCYGYTNLDVYAAGIQEDYSFGENVFSTTSEPINLPRTPGNIYNELLPVTNIANLSNRGLGIQLRFKGRNTDLSKPEPGHICQVLVVYNRLGGGPDA